MEIENIITNHYKGVLGNIITSNKELLKDLIKIHTYNIAEISYVYFLLNKDTNLIKIGCTTSILDRMKHLKSIFENTIGITPNFELIGLILCQKGNEKKIEKIMHNNFQQNRKYGEWFDLTSEEYLYDIIGTKIEIDNILIGVEDGFLQEQYIEVNNNISIKDLLNAHFCKGEYINEILNNSIKRSVFVKSANKILIDVLNKIGNGDEFKKINLTDRINKNELHKLKMIFSKLKLA